MLQMSTCVQMIVAVLLVCVVSAYNPDMSYPRFALQDHPVNDRSLAGEDTADTPVRKDGKSKIFVSIEITVFAPFPFLTPPPHTHANFPFLV